MTFKRTIRFEREATPPGVIRGVLATDGEASDGHVLSIAGGDVQPGIPLLFGHDDYSGERNLGSWIEFTKSAHAIRGEAVIELAGAKGSGSLEWRQDMAHMVAKGHVSGLSIRWEPTDEPKKRTDLAKDHPAWVDSKAERNPMKRYGMFFPRWRALEGSIVNLGADREAVIGRSETAIEPLRPLWRAALVGIDEQARAEALDELLAKAGEELLESIPVPDAPQAVAASVPTAAEYRQRYDESVRLILRDLRSRIGPEVRAAALEELRRVRGR